MDVVAPLASLSGPLRHGGVQFLDGDGLIDYA